MAAHKRGSNRAFPPTFYASSTNANAAPRKRPKTATDDAERMASVVDHALASAAELFQIQNLPLDPASVLARQGPLLARFVTPETRAGERERLQSVVARLRANQMRPSQVCPGVSDDCDYAKAQILIECEDQLRALDAVLARTAMDWH